MNVQKSITIDLNRPSKNMIHLGQGDSVREIVITFLKDGAAFDPTDGSSDVSGTVKYIKANGYGGEYQSAVEKSQDADNVFTVKILSEAVDVPGFTELFVKFKNGSEVLHSFPITLDVIRVDADADPTPPVSEVYIRKDAQTAKTSGMTQAVGIDSNGKLWTAPGGGGTDPFVVTITTSGQSYIANKSYSDIGTAVGYGIPIYAITPDGYGDYHEFHYGEYHFDVDLLVGDAMTTRRYSIGQNAITVTDYAIDNLTVTPSSIGAVAVPTVTTLTGPAATILSPSDNTSYEAALNSPLTSLEVSSYTAGRAFSIVFASPAGTPTTLSMPNNITMPSGFEIEPYGRVEINVDKHGYVCAQFWPFDD